MAVAVLAALTFSAPAKRAAGAGGGGGGDGGAFSLCTVTFCLFAASCNIGQLCYAAVGGSLVPYFTGTGFSEGDAALLAGPLLAAPNLVGKLGFGRLSDGDKTGGPLQTFQLVFVVLTLALVMFNLAALASSSSNRGGGGGSMGGGGTTEPSLALVAVATVLFGAGYGGFIAMQHTATMAVFGGCTALLCISIYVFVWCVAGIMT